MSVEETEGFPKRGTTLEGRVAQLLRLLGYKVSRNVFLEDHEIDVYAEGEDGKRIIVECKEYYTQLINRELILIFATKVRDINPDEAWLVTIYDFEPPALELCKRYGIFPINGYDLEELEEKVAKGPIKLGPVPSENRLLRLLDRQRIRLRRKRRNIEELKKIASEIEALRKSSLDLPPFLYPMYPSDLERKNIWLKELEATPKASSEGNVTATVVDIHTMPPSVRGFRVLKEVKVPISVIFSTIIIVLTIVLLYFKRIDLIDAGFCVFFGILPLAFYKKLVWKYNKTILKPVRDTFFQENVLNIPKETISVEERIGNIVSNRLYGIPAVLTDGTIVGHSKDFAIEKTTMKFQGMKIKPLKKIAEETGFNEAIVPLQNTRIYLDQNNKINIQINAVYVLSESFLKEETF